MPNKYSQEMCSYWDESFVIVALVANRAFTIFNTTFHREK